MCNHSWGSTGEKHLLVLWFSFSVSDVLLFCWILKLSAFADIVPLLCLWNISCVVQASQHLPPVRILSLYGCLYWFGWGKSFIHAIVFSCGCSESEWVKMHLCHILRQCPGSCSSLRKESRKHNGFIWAYCQDPVFLGHETLSTFIQNQRALQSAFGKEILLWCYTNACWEG